jgi:hypothetical protein
LSFFIGRCLQCAVVTIDKKSWSVSPAEPLMCGFARSVLSHVKTKSSSRPGDKSEQKVAMIG